MIEGVQEVRCFWSDDRNTYVFRKVLFQYLFFCHMMEKVL